MVQRIKVALTSLPPDRARMLAAFAYLLGRVAAADHAVTDSETTTMEAILRETGALPADQAAVAVQIARVQSQLFRGTEDFRVGIEFGQIATMEEKRALLRCLFAVSAADSSVVTREDNEIRQIAIEIKIPHEEFVSERARWRDRLAVLQPGRGIRPSSEPA